MTDQEALAAELMQLYLRQLTVVMALEAAAKIIHEAAGEQTDPFFRGILKVNRQPRFKKDEDRYLHKGFHKATR